MQKKLLAVAVAGVFAAPAAALAQSSTVQIYGTVIVNYNIADFGKASATVDKPRVDYLNGHDSNIGFRGEEKLGGGLSAWFQCESSFTLSSGGNDGLCARNSAMGFKGGFGNVFVGTWDAPMKLTAAPARPYSTSGIFGMGGMMWNESANNVGNGALGLAGPTGSGTSAQFENGFSRRQTNTINYHADFSGVGVFAQVSAANEATASTNAMTYNKPRMWGLGANYAAGPMYLGAGYERHKDFNPASQAAYNGGSDNAWTLSGAYTIGTFKLSGIFSHIKYETAAAANLKVSSWGLFGDWAIGGPHKVRMSYVQQRDTKGNHVGTIGSFVGNNGAGNTGAKQYTLQYAYGFSKRTEVNFGYSRITNEANAIQRLQTSGPRAFAGEDQSAFALGIKHSF
jgi:predicted porin